MDDEDGDPLEAYCRLVHWTVENYPQGHSAESGLLELLEEATRVLKDDRGRNGEEHAAVLERDGRRKEADAAYALGIARKASSLDHLESRYCDFQKRMMSNMSLPNAQVQPVASRSSQAPRQALATTASSVPASHPGHLHPELPCLYFRYPSASSNSRIQIFVDPTGAQAQAAEDTANEWNDLGTRKTRIKENVPEVKKLAGSTLKQAGRSKRIASSSGAGMSGSGSGSKIVPFRDPAPGDMPPPPVPTKKEQEAASKAPARGFVPFVDGPEESAASSTDSPTFTPFRDESAVASPAAVVPIADSIMKIKKADKRAPAPTTEAEALRKDPLKNYAPDSLGSLSSYND
ncbi:hypothetical protein BDZ97DRAFT_2021605 [Flammula alnicola]|nr:hypothetical protein BDZ97DRAFT_2021605 [Flammula alnicola]